MNRVTVVGAGIVGASIAYRLAESGRAEVRLIDQSTPGGGTSAASMAWLNASNKRPRDYFDLNNAGVVEYHRLREEVGAEWVHLTGTLAQASFTPDLAARVDEMEEWGYRVERTTAGQAFPEFVPTARFTDPDELVAHYPDEGWIDTDGGTKHLVGLASRHGALYQQGCAVVRVESDGPGYRLTLADGTTFTTDVLVNAAGPRADRLASMIGRELPLAPTKGMTVRFEAPDLDIRKIILSEQVEVRPDVGGTVRAHSDGVDGLMSQGAATDREEIVRVMRTKVAGLFPELADAPVAGVFMANRPIPVDQFSSLGPVTGFDNYFEAVTHSGVTMGPLIGRLMTAFIVEGTHDPLITDRFSPDRFAAYQLTDAL